MDEDTYTEVEETSRSGRIGGASKGILFGLILFVGSFPLLFWNEGRAVKTYRAMKEGGAAVVSVSGDMIDPANDGHLVHVTGKVVNRETLTDPLFHVYARSVKLRRSVEMYQWRETKESRKEKEAAAYSYSKDWFPTWIDSNGFNKKDGHQNPANMPFSSEVYVAGRVELGPFSLSDSLKAKIDTFTPLTMDSSGDLPDVLGKKGRFFQGGYYMGRTPEDPAVGDVKISFQVVEPATVSIIAKQSRNTLFPYLTETGGKIEMVRIGVHDALEMFKQARHYNTVLTWGFRLGGFLAMIFGLLFLLSPLSPLRDAVPFVDHLSAAGTGIVSFVLACVFSLLTIGIAWVICRPLLGISLSAAALFLVGGILVRSKKHGLGAAPSLSKTTSEIAETPSRASAGPSASAPQPSDGPSKPEPPPGPGLTGEHPSLNAAEWFKRGIVHFRAGKFQKALYAFTMSIGQNADYAEAYYNRSVAFSKVGGKEESLEDLRTAARLGHPKAQQFLRQKNIGW